MKAILEIPDALIPAAEQLQKGPVRAKSATDAILLLCSIGAAHEVTKYGPPPPIPKKQIRNVRDLQPGDFLCFNSTSCRIRHVRNASIGDIPYPGVCVILEGTVPPLRYGYWQEVETFDGPILVRESWPEIQLSQEGRDAIALLRLAADDKNNPNVAAKAKNAAKRKAGRKSNTERDNSIANEYSRGLESGEWTGQADYLRQRHMKEFTENANAAKSWLSTLLKRARAGKLKKSACD